MAEANSKAMSLCANVPPYRPFLTNRPIAFVFSIHSLTLKTNVCKPASCLKWSNSTTLKYVIIHIILRNCNRYILYCNNSILFHKPYPPNLFSIALFIAEHVFVFILTYILFPFKNIRSQTLKCQTIITFKGIEFAP